MRPRTEQPIGKLILRDLESGPATIHDIGEVVGLNVRNIRPYMRILHEQGDVHIVGWEQRTGPALPVWNIGNGKDKQRPKRKYKR